MPLCWAHSEYIKLVRSATEGKVFDLIPEVADRYLNRPRDEPIEVWKFTRQVGSMPAGGTLRIQAAAAFRLRWTCDEWAHSHETESASIETGHAYADIRLLPDQRAPARFTFFWTKAGRWEGRDFQVTIRPKSSEKSRPAPMAASMAR